MYKIFETTPNVSQVVLEELNGLGKVGRDGCVGRTGGSRESGHKLTGVCGNARPADGGDKTQQVDNIGSARVNEECAQEGQEDAQMTDGVGTQECDHGRK